MLSGIGAGVLDLNDIVRCGNVRKERSDDERGADKMQETGMEGPETALAGIGDEHRGKRESA